MFDMSNEAVGGWVLRCERCGLGHEASDGPMTGAIECRRPGWLVRVVRSMVTGPSISNGKLSVEMRKVLGKMLAANNRIHREPGGFWRVNGDPHWSTGASTVSALVRRGVIAYSAMQARGRYANAGQFPIEAVITNPDAVREAIRNSLSASKQNTYAR